MFNKNELIAIIVVVAMVTLALTIIGIALIKTPDAISQITQQPNPKPSLDNPPISKPSNRRTGNPQRGVQRRSR